MYEFFEFIPEAEQTTGFTKAEYDKKNLSLPAKQSQNLSRDTRTQVSTVSYLITFFDCLLPCRKKDLPQGVVVCTA